MAHSTLSSFYANTPLGPENPHLGLSLWNCSIQLTHPFVLVS